MKKLFILIISLLILFKFGFAQHGGLISGTITDGESGYTLPGATLRLDKYNRYTISDNKGYYEFLNVPEGEYELTVSYIGYKPYSGRVIVSKGKNSVINPVMQENVTQLEGVVILGEGLKGQAKALNTQKTNTNISNIISADQVGRFPDANMGDALKRIPGITMQNDQGEARNIIIRGLAPQLNSVALNGNRIPSAEGDNRNVQMDLIPSDMISMVEVSKTLTSDMDADAIGGSVNLITRAVPNKQRISVTFSGNYNPIREKFGYSGSFIYGNRIFDNKFGFVLSASFLNKKYGSDNIEASWKKGKKDQVYVAEHDIRIYDIQRIRRSFSGAFDYKINDNNSVAADVIYNWRDDRENRYRLRYKVSPEYDGNNEISGFKADISRETKGGIDNRRNNNTRLEDQRVQNYSLRGQHLLSEKFDFDWNVSYSKATEDRPNERYIQFRQKGVTVNENLSDGKHPFIQPEGENLSEFEIKDLTENHNFTAENEFAFKVNARIPLSVISEQKGRLRFGVRGRLKDKERDNIFYAYEALDGDPAFLDLPSTFHKGNGFAPGSKYVAGQFVKKTYLGGLKLKDNSLFHEEVVPEEYLSSNYDAKEQVWAGYLRWDQNISKKLVFILGVRAEHTTVDYTGNYVIEDEETFDEISKTHDYLNILPGVTMKYNMKNNMAFRAAFTTALARPDYYDLVPYADVSLSDKIISAGNPGLKATYSYNVDLMYEYYMKSVGLIAIGGFYKNLDKFIYRYMDITYTKDDFARDFPNRNNPIGPGEEWEYSRSRNGSSVDVFGFEASLQWQLDFLPGNFLRNFGVYLNYTYTWSEAKGITDADGNKRENVALPGTAPHIFNASLSWENKKISARASLNYTTGYLDVLGENEFYDSYYDKQLFLDVNASYKITPQLRVFAEANNLTNQPLRYYQGISGQVQQLEYYKPSFNLGLKWDF